MTNTQKVVAICGFAICFYLSAHAQTEFDTAHAVLDQLANDRGGGSDKVSSKGRLAARALEVEHLLNNGISDLLDQGTPVPAGNLERALRTALQVGAESSDAAEAAFVFSFGAANKPSYLVVYNIEYCVDCSLSWVGAFRSQDGRYQVQASLENPLPNQSLKAVPVFTSDSELKVLVYGTTWGDAHSRLNAVVYSFTGLGLEKIWARSGLPQGTLDARPGAIVISFRTQLNPPWRQRTETYSVTNKGVELMSASEHPAD